MSCSTVATRELLNAPGFPFVMRNSCLLSLRGVGRRFGGIRALDGVDLCVQQGHIHGLIGPNGAGKTTLFDIVTGITRADTGYCAFDGTPLSGDPAQAVRLGIARTFQNIRLFASASAADNVITGMHRNTRSGLLSALWRGVTFQAEEADCRALALRLLDYVGLGRHAERPASSLSYGDRRRLEIARALATTPRLLALDEPAAGMNASETTQLAELIRRIRADGISVLVIEHDMRFVMSLCDRITVLDSGQRIADDTPDAIRRNPLVIDAYLGSALAQHG